MVGKEVAAQVNPNFGLIENLLKALDSEVKPEMVADYISWLYDEELDNSERVWGLRKSVESSFELKDTFLVTAVFLWKKVNRPLLVHHAFDPTFTAFTRLMDDLAVFDPGLESLFEKVEKLIASNEE